MAKIILANAFSINMLTQNTTLNFQQITADEAKTLIIDNNGGDSIIGHPDTARVVGNILDIPVACNRVSWAWPKDENVILLVAQLTGPRLPEGATTLPEGAVIKWWKVTI